VIPPADQAVAALLAALNDGDFHALHGLADRLEDLGEDGKAALVRSALDIPESDVVNFRRVNVCTAEVALRTIRRRRCLGVLLSFRRIG
jgi:hypothetical protein